jgi:hypothetical protein
VTDAELLANSTNEAIQANLILEPYRDQLLRMAPWDCAMKYNNAIYITSVPGTPENTSPALNNWVPGQPAPPFAYEYYYPGDCLRMCYIIPAQQTGFADGVPITTAVTGGAPALWQGSPIKFKVSTDQFREASGLAIVDGGLGHQVNDLVILGVDILAQTFNAGAVPAGIIRIKVLTVDGSGTILTASLEDFDTIEKNALLYSVPTYTLLQVATTGIGTGAQATVSGVSQAAFSARVILTNQEFATLAYVGQVTDPNVMDPMFIEAWANVVGAGMAMALTEDKSTANLAISITNKHIEEARKVDGNEGLTINDVTPDFIRTRGIAWTEYYTGPYSQFDWGSYWPVF